MTQPSTFHEVRFPTDISFGSSGGPQRRTDIVTLGSGREHRNQKWAASRRRYDAGYGVKHIGILHEVIAFYEARRGPLYGFRYRDPLDWKSCLPSIQPTSVDQSIGIGDGEVASFQLIKLYGDGNDAYSRTITKPVSGTVLVAIDGAPIPEGEWTLDATTGFVIFGENSVPPSGANITAGFEFDVPVRFASDELTVSLAAFSAGEIPSIPLIEVVL